MLDLKDLDRTADSGLRNDKPCQVSGRELKELVSVARESAEQIKFLEGKLSIAEDAIKEAASRAHNRLATLHDMQRDYQLSSP